MDELSAAESGRAPLLACSGKTAVEELCLPPQQFSLVVSMQTKTAQRWVVLQQVPHRLATTVTTEV